MKIFHTSDLHLGRMLYGHSLTCDQQYFLEEVFLPKIRLEKPDLIFISGDIYDRKIASVESIKLFDSFLSSLLDLSIPAVIISGNHDSNERIAIMKTALRKSGIYLATSIEDVFHPVEINSQGEKIQLFLIPYIDPAYIRDFFPEDELLTENSCMKRLVEEIKPLYKDDYTRILLSHCFVAGSEISDSESTLFVGGSTEISTSVFADFDYVALGHLHRAQKAGKNGRYSGSPLKYSIDEEKHNKSFVSLTIENGAISHELVPIIPLHDVRRITGSFEELVDAGKKEVCNDYVELILTDSKPIVFAAERLREFYPNMLTISNNWTAAIIAGESSTARLKNADEITIFNAFMQDICGIDEETNSQKRLFEEILKEAQDN